MTVFLQSGFGGKNCLLDSFRKTEVNYICATSAYIIDDLLQSPVSTCATSKLNSCLYKYPLLARQSLPKSRSFILSTKPSIDHRPTFALHDSIVLLMKNCRIKPVKYPCVTSNNSNSYLVIGPQISHA